MRKAFDIPNILESLALDISKGLSWESAAMELYIAGLIPFGDVELARMKILPYL